MYVEEHTAQNTSEPHSGSSKKKGLRVSATLFRFLVLKSLEQLDGTESRSFSCGKLFFFFWVGEGT